MTYCYRPRTWPVIEAEALAWLARHNGLTEDIVHFEGYTAALQRLSDDGKAYRDSEGRWRDEVSR